MPTAEHMATLAALPFWTDSDVSGYVSRKLAEVANPAGEARNGLSSALERITSDRNTVRNHQYFDVPRDDRLRRLAAYDRQNLPGLQQDLQKVEAAGRAYVTKWYEKSHEWEWTPRIMDEFRRQKGRFDRHQQYVEQEASRLLGVMQSTASVLEHPPSFEQVEQEQRAADNRPTSPPFLPAYSQTPGPQEQAVDPALGDGPTRPASTAGQPARPPSRGR